MAPESIIRVVNGSVMLSIRIGALLWRRCIESCLSSIQKHKKSIFPDDVGMKWRLASASLTDLYKSVIKYFLLQLSTLLISSHKPMGYKRLCVQTFESYSSFFAAIPKTIVPTHMLQLSICLLERGTIKVFFSFN